MKSPLLRDSITTSPNRARPASGGVRRHVDEGRRFTIAASQRHHATNRLTGFDEKPSVEYLVRMGVHALQRTVLDRVPPGTEYGFDHPMLDLLAAKGQVHVQPHRGFWLDIGGPDDYRRAVDEFETFGPRLLGYA
jgi:NDP-mannose synthase